jgi:hypothetical protein
MALLLIDPFDQYGNLTELAKNYAFQGGVVALSPLARSGTTSVAVSGQVGSPSIQRAFPAQGNLFWQCSHFTTSMPNNAASFALNGVPATFGWHLMSGGAQRLSFVFDDAGRLCVYANGYNVLLGRSNQVLFPKAWASFSFHVIGGINGLVEVRRNDQLVLLLTNVDTRGGGAGTYDTIRLGRFYDLDADPGPYYYDDFMLWNNTGAAPNDFIGPRRLRVIVPKAQANVAGWVAKDAGTLWGSLDNVPPDAVAHYIAAGAIGATADLGFTAAPKNCSNVAGIAALFQARSDSAASIEVDLVTEGGEVITSAPVPLGVTDANFVAFFPAHNNGAPFTISQVNNITARLKRTA